LSKQFYSVSYKTYYNERLREVVFQGAAMHPLYLQVTYDRKTIFFKSYYFELFARPKYALMPTSILQVMDLESGLLDALIDEDAERFTLDGLLRKYRLWSVDVLDSCDGSFRQLLADVLREEGMEVLSAMVQGAGVAGIRMWRELGGSLDGRFFKRMKERILGEGHPYLPLVTYILETSPDGPICLPLWEWRRREGEIERWMGGARGFRGLEIRRVIDTIRGLVREAEEG